MSQFKTVRVCKWKRLQHLSDLRMFLSLKMPSIDVNGEKPDFAIVDIGYIEPGHGSKGKKQWLNTDDDVLMMYEKHSGKTSILLWAYSSVEADSSSKQSVGKKCGPNFEKHKESLNEVEEKYDELRKKHGNKYTVEQLRMWAQMIPLGKHDY